MTVTLKPITVANWREAYKLKVKEDQTSFVAPNLYSIAESQFYPSVEKRAIYVDDKMVGFIMWALDDENHDPPELWISRFMIDGEHQGNGYGRAAMQQVIALLKAEHVTGIFLSYEPENTGGAAFYAGLGFDETGRVEHGEVVVHLDLTI